MNALIRTWTRLGALGLGLGLLVAAGACSDDSSSTPDGPVVKIPDAKPAPDAALIDAPGSVPDSPATGNCFSGTPTTNAEIITACTTAQQIDINPTLPLLNTDGSLPDHQHK